MKFCGDRPWAVMAKTGDGGVQLEPKYLRGKCVGPTFGGKFAGFFFYPKAGPEV